MANFYNEAFRPQFHFSPVAGWLNDPNGMYYYDGTYHLCYQYLPDTHEHVGPKHWGHAVSEDMVHWQHLPIAIAPDDAGDIWSGCAVVDHHNHSGLQQGDDPVIVALYTGFRQGHQEQCVAYSNDLGLTWTKYEHNPVIENPGIIDFRDPNVIWHSPSQKWVMVLAAGDRAMFYTSNNLLTWERASEFGPGHGVLGGIWECPALFPLPVNRDPAQQKWVLLVSMNGGAPNGGSGTEYFIGDFDGRTFKNDNPAESVLWLDYGRDNYAAIPFSNMPEEDPRVILIGWMSNWWYAATMPTAPWRGHMTIPRQLALKGKDGGVRLVSRPVAELERLRRKQLHLEEVALLATTALPELDDLITGTFELKIVVEHRTASEWGIRLQNDDGEETVLGYDVTGRRLYINRQRSGVIDFSTDFAGYLHTAKLVPEEDQMQLHLFVDWSGVELYADDGEVWLSELIFPRSPINRATFFAKDGQAVISQLDVWTLASIWREKP